MNLRRKKITHEQCPRKHKCKADGNDMMKTIQGLKTEFNKEIEILKRSQAEMKMKLKKKKQP